MRIKLEEKIKPCPFCGSRKIYVYDKDYKSYVTCMSCHALMDNLGTMEENIEAWNRRVEQC